MFNKYPSSYYPSSTNDFTGYLNTNLIFFTLFTCGSYISTITFSTSSSLYHHVIYYPSIIISGLCQLSLTVLVQFITTSGYFFTLLMFLPIKELRLLLYTYIYQNHAILIILNDLNAKFNTFYAHYYSLPSKFVNIYYTVIDSQFNAPSRHNCQL